MILFYYLMISTLTKEPESVSPIPKSRKEIRIPYDKIIFGKNPVQDALSEMECRNESIGPLEEITNAHLYIEDKSGSYLVNVKVIQDYVGVDFTTNQPIYKRRIILPKDVC